MSSLELPPRIAVLGARGIGQVHARVFKNFNADICAILGSSHTTAKQAANQLNKSLEIISQPYSDFKTLIKRLMSKGYSSIYSTSRKFTSSAKKSPFL